MKKLSLKDQINDLRREIKRTDEKVLDLRNDDEFNPPPMAMTEAPSEFEQRTSGSLPPEPQYGEMHANLTLAHRKLEDARMRLGKVIQAFEVEGGESCFDRN